MVYPLQTRIDNIRRIRVDSTGILLLRRKGKPMRMRLDKVAEGIRAKVLTPGVPLDVEVECAYAGDSMSDLLNHARPRSVLVTNLSNHHVLRVAELMEVPAICFVNDSVPQDDIVAGAVKQGTAILVSPVGMFETCGLLYKCLGGESEP